MGSNGQQILSEDQAQQPSAEKEARLFLQQYTNNTAKEFPPPLSNATWTKRLIAEGIDGLNSSLYLLYWDALLL